MPANIDRFNKLVGLIFADLYQKFPVRQNMGDEDYVRYFEDDFAQTDEPVSQRTNFRDFFEGTVDWLIQTGFLGCTNRYATNSSVSYVGVYLSAHTLKALYGLPDSLGSKVTFGERMLSGAKQIGQKGGDAALVASVQHLISQAF